jgi:hypothetical protein
MEFDSITEIDLRDNFNRVNLTKRGLRLNVRMEFDSRIEIDV